MPRFKLQLRIAILIAGISLLFIFVFTSIQLRNHLTILRSYNKYRARVGTIIVKTTLETLLNEVPSDDMLSVIFNAAIASFSKEGIVEKISIITTDGKAIATNDPVVKKFGETQKDIKTYLKLSKEAGKDAWFFSTVNEKTKIVDIFIPLSVGPQVLYITKLSFSIGNIKQAMIDILVPVSLTVIAVVAGNILLGIILTRTVATPIKTLDAATKDIASGHLDRRVKIVTNDEIEELGDTFNKMAVALKKMKEKAENANPLTRLPGNNVIREEIEKRIKEDKKFVAIHTDLDHFKAYNDRYGVGKGDEVIKFTSGVLKKAIDEKGNPDDLLGHEGGDDFFLITSPEKAESIAEKVIKDFDSKIKDFYSESDRKKGYIEGKDRKGKAVEFPLMAISLAGVTNQERPILSYGELTNISIGVKQKAKESEKSIFLIDRRKI